MTEKEVDVVAEELARLGGISWYPGANTDPVLRVVTERYRDRARAAIMALDRYRAASQGEAVSPAGSTPQAAGTAERLRLGATVIYRPYGDRRAYACIVDQVSDGQIHLVPQLPGEDGWVRLPDMMTDAVCRDLQEQRLTGCAALGFFSATSETQHQDGTPR
ncbi:hypothetical protein [Microvirga antarctica]|uniref:hypothetical protein n=1 Tax=Microvirga antarctica TaxID=2819233 RepID=UPI001B30C274|nr:hypothetical protein [Microvirga antarctica]